MPDLTPQQRDAVKALGTGVVLRAGAGTGKTRVLAERFVAAVAAGGRSALDRVAALTFTDKAAGELRRRVRRECRVRLDSADDPDLWRGVLLGLEAASIGTFHTFCGEVVRRFAARAGVDPGFAILDDAIAKTRREEAVDAAIRLALIARDADLRELAVPLGLDAVRDHLVRLLADRSAEALDAWGAREPEELVATWREAFDKKGRPAVLRRFLGEIRPCLDLLESYGCDHHPKMRERRESLLDLSSRLLGAGDPRAVIEKMKADAKIQGGGTREKWPDPALYEAFSESFKSLREKHAKSALDGLGHDGASTDLAAILGVRLARLGASARREFAAMKRRRGALDFDDLLLIARDLLRDDAQPVRDDLARRFDLILVDEFQDTDPVQDEIVRAIAGPDRAGGRLFLVGDVKQSIYGFRGARPDLFLRHNDEFPEAGRLALTENFRSRPGVLDFVNALFVEAFPDYDRLTPGSADRLPGSPPAVIFSAPADDPEDGAERRPKPGRRDVKADRRDEAVRLARLVASWIDEGREVFDKEAEVVRPMRAGDVAFLFRTLNDVAPYERALTDEGLDFYVVGGTSFYAQQEVQDLINVLSVLDDPHDAVSLAGALRGPFFAMSDEGLYWLSTVRHGDLFAGLARHDEATLPDLSPRDRHRASRALALLTRWRGRKDREPIAALVDRVLDESGFEAALLGETLGDRKRANARKIVRLARRFDAEEGLALADFVARLRDDLRDPPREEQAATVGEIGDVVRLLTVHKAKGLEFPVVVLPDLDREPGGHHRHVVLDPELGPLLNLKADDDGEPDPESESKAAEPAGSLGWLVHRALRKEEDEAEALRVFYVAATRARDRLVLSTSGTPRPGTKSPALRLLLDRFDPATGHCLASLPDGWETPRVEVLRGTPVRATRAARRRRPSLRGVARLIESTPRPGHRELISPSSVPTRPPTFLDLEPSASRLDRLVRAILLDPRSTRRGALEDVAADLGRRQSPMSPPRLVAEAVARVRPWVEGPLGLAIAKATEVRRDVPWSTTWPPDAPAATATAIVGRLDLAYRDPLGGWHLLNVADAASPALGERLRLTLSLRLAPRLGLAPVTRARLLIHGEGGGLKGEEGVDDATIAGWLETLNGATRTFIKGHAPAERA